MEPRALAAVGVALFLSVALVGTVDAASPCDEWNTPKFFKGATADDINYCLDEGADIRARTEKAWTPLHVAARYADSADVVDALIDAGADVNARDEDGWTPLHMASVQVTSAVMRALLDAGAHLDAQGKDAWTPLHMAAAYSESPDLILTLVNAEPGLLHARADEGKTPLHVAAALNKEPAVIRQLLEAGAKTEETMKGGFTPFHVVAALGKEVEVIDYFVDAGVEITFANQNGFTPLHLAAAYNSETAVLKKLVELYPDAVNLTTRWGDFTPLHVAAAYSNDSETIATLIDAGANVNAVDYLGSTPLHWAAIEKNLDLVPVLVSYGGDLLYKSYDGQTPLDSLPDGYIDILDPAGPVVNQLSGGNN